MPASGGAPRSIAYLYGGVQDLIQTTVLTDGTNGASGTLTFSVLGAYCGTIPVLAVDWPTSTSAPCDCVAH